MMRASHILCLFSWPVTLIISLAVTVTHCGVLYLYGMFRLQEIVEELRSRVSDHLGIRRPIYLGYTSLSLDQVEYKILFLFDSVDGIVQFFLHLAREYFNEIEVAFYEE